MLASFSLITSLLVSTAPPTTQRYALIIGANRGAVDDHPLQHALDDADSLATILTDLGGFRADHVAVLHQPAADTVRDAFDKVRAELKPLHGDSLLIVYYSGHADALALHLGSTTLPWQELVSLTDKAGATARVLVVDACRAGQITRSKGTRLEKAGVAKAPDFVLPRGMAILASTSPDEDAQESEQLGGSLFTHHLLAALQGAADSNGDGRVTLNEAFQYSADRTVASSATTMAGLQHATYRYHLSGHADLPITMPAYAGSLAAVRLEAAGTYLIRRASSIGPLAIEAIVSEHQRTVWLPPGNYYIQRRTVSQLFEGTRVLAAGRDVGIGESTLLPMPYETLALKGSPESAPAPASLYALSLGAGGAIAPNSNFAWRQSVSVLLSQVHDAWALDAQIIGGRASGLPQAAYASSAYKDLSLTAGARLCKTWGVFTGSLGGRVGALYTDERYTLAGSNTPVYRGLVAPVLDTVLRAEVSLPASLFVALEGAFRLTLVRPQSSGSLLVSPQPLATVNFGFTL